LCSRNDVGFAELAGLFVLGPIANDGLEPLGAGAGDVIKRQLRCDREVWGEAAKLSHAGATLTWLSGEARCARACVQVSQGV
jgi:hypothetical protein